MVEEERSAGVVIFYDREGSRKYLLLHYPAGHWDFPKGNIERGEKPIEAAKREAYEETGIKELEFISGFEKKIQYFYRRQGVTVRKTVIYYLARSRTMDVKLSWEHKGFKWLSYEEALRQITYKSSREVLVEAEEHLRKMSMGIDRFLT
jgi:8-oxo-dGTP pyrophosphatase MutT (NUDIX family)